MGGFRKNGGRSKTYTYTNISHETMKLNTDEIRMAKVLDSLKLNWSRNFKYFHYYDINNKQRKFYPDFYISDFNVYLEYKGWVTEKMTHKMNNAKTNNKDLNLVIVYGEDKRYAKLGLNILMLEEDNNILLEYLKNI